MKTIEKEILNFDEVRALLNVSKSTLYKLTSSKLIPHFKPTKGKLYFKRDEVMLWLTGKPQLENSTISNLENMDSNGK